MIESKDKKSDLGLSKKKGFTLVEVIVTIVIIGIIAVIATPTVKGYFDSITLRDYIRTARLAEDTVMSLAGMQYAKNGNPIVGNPHVPLNSVYQRTWASNYSLPEDTFGSQYIYVDAWRYQQGQKLIRIAPANLGAPGDERKSAGITEYTSRTGEEIPIEKWIAHNNNVNECEQRISQSIFVYENNSNITINKSNSGYFDEIAKDKYFRYERYGSWLFRTINGKEIVVLHNFRIKGTYEKGDLIENIDNFEKSLELVGDQWNVYEFDKATYSGWNASNSSYSSFTSSYKYIGSV